MTVPIIPPAPLETPGVLLQDSLADAARKILCFQYARMILNEQGTILGQDIEKLHDMRVAIRRLRVAVSVFKIRFSHPGYKKSLCRTAEVLGGVRDLDVFMDKTQVYLSNLPESERLSLTPLLIESSRLRNAARKKMLKFFGGKNYHQLRQELKHYQEQTTMAVGLENALVADQALGLVVARFDFVLETGKYLVDPTIRHLHALRIAFKKLRYAIEFLVDLLDAEGYFRCIELLKQIQDCLGDIHDANLAIDLVSDLLAKLDREASWRESIRALTGYLAFREAELSHLKNTFPRLWDQFVAGDFERHLKYEINDQS